MNPYWDYEVLLLSKINRLLYLDESTFVGKIERDFHAPQWEKHDRKPTHKLEQINFLLFHT